ncbi:hypothetical protein MGG_16604 [Pyricularia oryzae 70-15]|uniref:Uncharacterized protein n=3 Tax=Pyricularia oryzae TaxID=318829 RepID=G4N0A4_PYRO7|nr:uncharacterized protein MGG_16604 [Pyricularia oryzae 70-15]EHA51442.1 hypothetical protein MGG_16604 [Pyricularia oryzae 70-15]ELQ34105.1 hypothetical protein OOU_Y34scaffold00797g4 [Pyricularia oryzae Y34]KAI7910464.1 hypothetical protein M0657_011358 [Pyricularia oryzae]KAI7910962.1 hypothetical protein M9X92_010783 [Pyricularia oryzae]
MGGYMYGVSVGSVLGVAVEEYSDAESAGLRLVAGHVGKSIRVLVVEKWFQKVYGGLCFL